MTQGTPGEEGNNNAEDIETFAPDNAPEVSPPGIVLPGENPKSGPSAIDRVRELTRGSLAFLLFAIYGGLMGYILFLVNNDKIPEAERKELLTLLVTSQSALMGSALGFYFGGKREN